MYSETVWEQLPVNKYDWHQHRNIHQSALFVLDTDGTHNILYVLTFRCVVVIAFVI